MLIFISLFERRVWVLADRGINRKVTPGRWDEIVSCIVQGIKQKRGAEAVCAAVANVGKLLADHFPLRDDGRCRS